MNFNRIIFSFIILIFLINLPSISFQQAFANDENVVLNIKNHVYHKENCKVIQKCTKCIHTTKDRAINVYHATACKKCFTKKHIKKHHKSSKHSHKTRKHHKHKKHKKTFP